LAVTISPIATQSNGPSASPSTAAPTAAASSGLTLMKIPNECAGTRRRASRSATIGTTDDSTPAAAAQASAPTVGGWAISAPIPIGTYTSAERAPATAEPPTPGRR